MLSWDSPLLAHMGRSDPASSAGIHEGTGASVAGAAEVGVG